MLKYENRTRQKAQTALDSSNRGKRKFALHAGTQKVRGRGRKSGMQNAMMVSEISDADIASVLAGLYALKVQYAHGSRLKNKAGQ